MARVLIAEDDTIIQDIMKCCLERFNVECLLASDGIEAKRILESGAVDLALLDIKMPKMDGLQVVKWVRNSEGKLSRLPMIAVTAYVLSDFVQELLRAGFNKVLTKPFRSEDLVQIIMSL